MKKMALFTALSIFSIISCSAVKLTITTDPTVYGKAVTEGLAIEDPKKTGIPTYKVFEVRIKVKENKKFKLKKKLRLVPSIELPAIKKGKKVKIEISGRGAGPLWWLIGTGWKTLASTTYDNMNEDKKVKIRFFFGLNARVEIEKLN